MEPTTVALALLIGGIVGGLAFWLLAVREWRRRHGDLERWRSAGPAVDRLSAELLGAARHASLVPLDSGLNMPEPAVVATVWHGLPVKLTDERRAYLVALATGSISPPDVHPIERALAPAMLSTAEGDYAAAVERLFRVLDQAGDAVIRDPAAFVPTLAALMMAQQFDRAGQLLTARHGGEFGIGISIEEPGPGPHLVRWEIGARDSIRFVFDPALLSAEDTRNSVLQFEWLMPLITEYMRGGSVEIGAVIVNLWDAGLAPGLAFCANRPDCVLVPDNLFISTRGYEDLRRHYEDAPVAWADRAPVAFWRGSTSGQIIDHAQGWQSLPRIKLCRTGRMFPRLIDAKLTSVVQIDDDSAQTRLNDEGLMGDFVAPGDFNRYRYQIDIDGNTNSWPGLYCKLLSGSPVLKVASPQGYRQWYYDRLVPWINYVPVQTEMDDLTEKVEWLRSHDDLAQAIGTRGWELARSLDYPGELTRARVAISAAICSVSAGR